MAENNKRLMDIYNAASNDAKQQMFYEYLQTEGKSESSCKQYALSHPKTSAILDVVYEVSKKDSLFDVVDLFQVKSIYSKVNALEANKKCNNALSATIYNYEHFLDYLESNGINDNVTYWILPANNSFFRIIDFFKEHNQVDWKQGNYKYNIGDIAFMYNSTGYQRILQMVKIIAINIEGKDTIQDREYWVDDSDYENSNSQKHVRFELISKLNEDDDRLSVDVLKRYGLTSNIQGSIKVPNKKLLNKILEVFENKTNVDVLKTNKDSRYWIYAPGDQASKWDSCQERKVMSLGWEDMGDLRDYSSREEMVSKLQEIYNKPNESFMNDSLALWQFVRDMKIGDVIYAKKGTGSVVGRGVVVGDYEWDEDANCHNSVRKVEWTHIGEWVAPYRLALKTLTRINKGDITSVNKLEALFDDSIVVPSLAQREFAIKDLISTIKSTQLIYDDTLIKRFAYSLLTKPFIILSGLAGSGKTQLALAFAKAMVEDEDSQLCFVSVGADWTNREPLLGFPNALQDKVYQKPESGVLQLMMEAETNPTKPYFLILDEMNLSYVERYFADFLSAMEAKDMKIKLWDNDGDDIPSAVSLSKNLFIIGTINVDETTYMFSPKVLDRANVIEFKVSEGDMESFLDQAPNVDMSACEGKSADMAEDFVKIAKEKKDLSTEANEVLKKFFKELKTVNAEFGYRTATEIGRFISLAKDNMKTEEAIDSAIVQKLLPKLHGSRKKIVRVLEALWVLCGCKEIASIEENDLAEAAQKAKYPLSADKILRMYKSAIDNGFTSFAEA